MDLAIKPRVVLISPAEADPEALIAANRADAAFHHPWAAPFTDRPGFDAWRARPEPAFVAREAEGGALVGVINLSNVARGRFLNATLGYWGYSATAGRGLMGEALGLVIDTAFGPLGLHRLEANIQPGNERSLRLVRRLGFRLEGYSPRFLFIDGAWRDHERWTLLAD